MNHASNDKLKNGRITALSQTTDLRARVQIQNLQETFSIDLNPEETRDLNIGDVVEVNHADPQTPSLRVLTRSLRPGSLKWNQHILDSRRLKALKIRARVERGIRDFFMDRDFFETRTPLLVLSPGMEIHIRPFRLETGAYLPTSPEFAMKRLLVGGLERIFQICPSYRYEPLSTTHHPEFTMLEWYRAYDHIEAIQKDTEDLVETLAMNIHGKPEFTYQGKCISVKTPWPRLRVRDLFSAFGVDLVRANTPVLLGAECTRLGIQFSETDTWDDLYFRIWLNLIEPKLPENQAVFVERYPRSQAALAVLDTDSDGSVWSKRFEFYIGGLEIGNAFEELTDASEQRMRFIRDMETRTHLYGESFPKSPIDEEFLEALEEGLPPSGGIAVGVDRLVMLLSDEPVLEKTIWLRSYPGTEDPEPAIY